MSVKVAQNDCSRKMNDFDTFTKNTKNEGDWSKIIFAIGFEKLPKSAINRPIWSHCRSSQLYHCLDHTNTFPNKQLYKRKIPGKKHFQSFMLTFSSMNIIFYGVFNQQFRVTATKLFLNNIDFCKKLRSAKTSGRNGRNEFPAANNKRQVFNGRNTATETAV